MQSARPAGSDPESQVHGIVGGFRRLKADGSATASELSEFLRGMKGKSPQEMLGTLAKSSLILSTLAAAGITLVLLVVFTVGPYLGHLVFGSTDNKQNNTAKAPATAPADNQAKNDSTKTTPTADKTNEKPSAENIAKMKKNSGSDKIIDADPQKNPLDIDDDLLKIK